MYIKILPGYKKIFNWFRIKCKINVEDNNMALFTIENYYRVQIFTELFLQAIPMMIVQVTQNNNDEWKIVGFVSFLIALCILVKNGYQVIAFISHRVFDNVESTLRPSEEEQRNRRDRNEYFNLKSYLNEPDDHMLDDEGNTTLHQATRLEELEVLENQATMYPHMLFILNQMGMTPLDTAIFEGKNDRADLLLKKSK